MNEEYRGMSFGKYIETMRKKCESRPSMRQTAIAIGVSPQFYSEVEKGRRGALSAERLATLKTFLGLTQEEAQIMYDLANATKKSKDITLPQDFPDYIVENDYVMAALRTAKELDASEEEWMQFVAEMRERRKESTTAT